MPEKQKKKKKNKEMAELQFRKNRIRQFPDRFKNVEYKLKQTVKIKRLIRQTNRQMFERRNNNN